MEKVNVYITDKQFKEITSRAEQAGVTFSEMLRRILDERIKNGEEEQNHSK